MYQTHRELADSGDTGTRIFRTLEDAFAWLGIEAFDPMTLTANE
jgi:hypothetical protein